MAQVNENPGIMLYSRIRKSPYFYASRRHGVQLYSVYNHMYHPRHYGDPVEEYWHLLNHVTLWDVAVERNVEVTGPDGFRFAQLLTCRDLSACAVGQGKYVLITAPDGGILNDPVMLRLDENTFWFALADSDVLPYAQGLAAHAGMDVQLSEAEAYPLQIQGPKSKDVVRTLFGDEILDLGYYRFRRLDLDGIPLILTRTGWTSRSCTASCASSPTGLGECPGRSSPGASRVPGASGRTTGPGRWASPGWRGTGRRSAGCATCSCCRSTAAAGSATGWCARRWTGRAPTGCGG